MFVRTPTTTTISIDVLYRILFFFHCRCELHDRNVDVAIPAREHTLRKGGANAKLKGQNVKGKKDNVRVELQELRLSRRLQPSSSTTKAKAKETGRHREGKHHGHIHQHEGHRKRQ